jgi:hypothetical protein
MRLEQEFGFRSSFNFIPEGPYVLPDDLRSELQRSGFEIGVHDLHHDGKLYQSRKAFVKSALRINQYLKEWGAVGFRSGFMLHNLEWAHRLNILYEASTFDTDPFEPQPEGVGTVFPFWVPPSKPLNAALSGTALHVSGIDRDCLPAGQGYIELPYTLAQDSTVFSLLGERHPDIWFQKLDWLAKNGGMVLVNVHLGVPGGALHAPASAPPFKISKRLLACHGCRTCWMVQGDVRGKAESGKRGD